MRIYLNKRFLSLKKREAEIFNSGLFRGYGVFETMRAYKENIVYLDAHLARFARSAGILRLKIPYSKKYLKSVILKTVRLNKFQDASVKLAAFQGQRITNIAVIVKKYSPYPQEKYKQGLRIKISNFCWTPDLKFAQAKTFSRALLELAYQEAKVKGFDEAVLFNNSGHLVECTRTNIFLVKNRKIYTPSLDCGCLEGITREAIFVLAKGRGMKVYEKKLTKKDMFTADEVFLTNSLVGVIPVSSCDKKTFAFSVRSEITQMLMQEYNKIRKRRNHV